MNEQLDSSGQLGCGFAGVGTTPGGGLPGSRAALRRYLGGKDLSTGAPIASGAAIHSGTGRAAIDAEVGNPAAAV